MSLDFTNIKDEQGAAIFFIDDGTETGSKYMQDLRDDVARRTRKQTIVLSGDDKRARDIIHFYKLRGTQFVLIVRDDDQLHHVWSDGERFDASHIAYTAEQTG